MPRRTPKPEHFMPREHFRAGREHEQRLFGKVDVDNVGYRRALKKVAREGRGGKLYVSYNDALDLARQSQPGDPTNPQADFLRELRLELIERLGIESDAQAELVNGYTAVGTPLDVLHGVDAFVVVSHEGYDIPVTLDATLRPEKLERVAAASDFGPKADVLVGEVPDLGEDEDAYLQAIEEVAIEVMKKVYEKIEQEITARQQGVRRRLRRSPPPEIAATAQ